MPIVQKNSSGFTLFELLIVVVLIAILYGVFINRLQLQTTKVSTGQVTLANLHTLLEQFPAERRREIICAEPCKTCSVALDGKVVKSSDFSLFNKAPVVWKPDRYGEYKTMHFSSLIDPEHGTTDICFRYRLFRNDSASSYIVQADDTHFFVFKPYMDVVKTYATLDDAKNAFRDESLIPTEQRNYNF